MLFYFHPELWITTLILLFITVVPFSVALLAFFVIRDVMKWKKVKRKKIKIPSNTN